LVKSVACLAKAAAVVGMRIKCVRDLIFQDKLINEGPFRSFFLKEARSFDIVIDGRH